MIVGLDAGNYEVKAVFQGGHDRFPSDLGEYRERNLEQRFSENDMVVEYWNKKFFAGTLAKYESEFSARIMGDSKWHEDCKLRILIALHRIGHDVYQIVVGQPIGKHVHQEKEEIKGMLKGHHTVTINSTRREFFIPRVEVAAEGGSAFWASPRDGLVRIIDIGSGTVNCATLHNKRYIDRDSFSIMVGMNTTKTRDMSALARNIAAEAGKKWSKNDMVKVVGGAGESMAPYLQEHFPRTEVIRPSIGRQVLSPVFANAVGFYRIGAGIYDN